MTLLTAHPNLRIRMYKEVTEAEDASAPHTIHIGELQV